MGRKILVLGFLLSLLALPVSIHAQGDSATPGGKIREAVKNRAEDVQIRREKIREEMKLKRVEFKARLQTIRDEVKRRVVERIDTRMESTNKRAISRFSNVLDKLQSILNRLIGKAQEAKAAVIDSGNIDLAVESAQTAMHNARSAVASQGANMYVIEIASESALKNDVGSVVSQLRSDLKGVHQTIVDAKQAVQQVLREIAKSKGKESKEENSATSSGSE